MDPVTGLLLVRVHEGNQLVSDLLWLPGLIKECVEMDTSVTLLSTGCVRGLRNFPAESAVQGEAVDREGHCNLNWRMSRPFLASRAILICGWACSIAACADGSSRNPGTTAATGSTAELSALVDGAAGLMTPMIGSALSCGKPATAGNLRPGGDLQRHQLDAARFPEARCNDGTPAVLYYRPFEGEENRNRWVIQLQGGGGCTDGATCAERWCSYEMPFGTTQMSSTLAPRVGIVADGLLNRARTENPLRHWNHVFLRYCTSDGWSGTRSDVVFDTTVPGTTTPVRYRLHFNGAHVFDAAVRTLRQDGPAALVYTLDGGRTALPDLDEATTVLLMGASAGGAGTIRNADRFTATLRQHNTRCQAGGVCALRVGALIDSIVGPDRSTWDWSRSPECTVRQLCTYDAFLQNDYQRGSYVAYGARLEDSCESWHRANRPGEEWRCLDDAYAVQHHVTTPMFVRMGQTDSLFYRLAVEGLFGLPGRGTLTLGQFAAGVRTQLARVQNAQTLANERSLIRTPPGTFGPSCQKHEAIGSDDSVYDVWIEQDGTQVSFLSVLGNWMASNGLVTNLVTRVGGRDSCTP